MDCGSVEVAGVYNWIAQVETASAVKISNRFEAFDRMTGDGFSNSMN